MVNQPDPNMNQQAPQQPQYQAPPQQPQYQQNPYQQPQYQPPQPQVVMFDQEDVNLNKGLAVLAYLVFPLALIQNIKMKSEFVAYHLNNMLLIYLLQIICVLCAIIPVLGWIVAFAGNIAVLVFWIMGLLNVKNGIGKPVPILGGIKTRFIR